MRYVIVRRAEADDPSCDDIERDQTPQPPQPTVYSGEEFINTGVLSPDGNEIYRHVGPLPIGFLADHSEA